MRISTAEITSQAILAIDNQSSALQTTQNEVSTGLAVQNAADNPVAASQIVQLSQQQAQLTQYGSNLQSAQTRLSLEESSLSTATTTLQSIRDLAVQAGDATLNDSDRQQIATQIQTQIQALLGTANSKDSNGEYLFAGYATQTQPFLTDSAGNVSYQGDSGNRLIQISANQTVADSDTGATAFMDIAAGNGTFTTAANAANTGSASIDGGSVLDSTQWVPDNYTLTFTSPTNYQITDTTTGTTVVANGTYTSGTAIQFDGVEVTVSGTPAAGDSFNVAPSGNQSMFATLTQLSTALSQPADTAASKAQLATSLASALTNIDQDVSHLSTVSASVGARLNLLTAQTTTNTATGTTLTSQQSNLQDVDYASAVSTLNEQMVGLQAAEQSYAAIAQLSLFKYLTF
ncbi:MAG TPA: flagellar hook-associated protein FlgL [Steroidobacteraceae bacterium]|jgi:flagellar hook-associated protein 3 FlgL|nr:flagellar hook-associated protein FlgL [Steroidobacteraceae bacterium]